MVLVVQANTEGTGKARVTVIKFRFTFNCKALTGQWNGLLPLDGIAMCQAKDFSNQRGGGDYEYSTYRN